MTKSKNKTNSKKNNTQKGGWGVQKFDSYGDQDLIAVHNIQDPNLLGNPYDSLCTHLKLKIKQEFDGFYETHKAIPFHLPDRIRFKLLQLEIGANNDQIMKNHVHKLRIELDRYINDLAQKQITMEGKTHGEYIELIRKARYFHLPEVVGLSGYYLDERWPSRVPIFKVMGIRNVPGKDATVVTDPTPIMDLDTSKKVSSTAFFEPITSEFGQFLQTMKVFTNAQSHFFTPEIPIAIPDSLKGLLVTPLPANLMFSINYKTPSPLTTAPPTMPPEPLKRLHPNIKQFEEYFRNNVHSFLNDNSNIRQGNAMWKSYADGELGVLLEKYYEFYQYVLNMPYMIRILNSILGLCFLLIANTQTNPNSTRVLREFCRQGFTTFYLTEFNFYIAKYQLAAEKGGAFEYIYTRLELILSIFTKFRLFTVGRGELKMSIFQRTIYENMKNEQFQRLSKMLSFTGYNDPSLMTFLMEHIEMRDLETLKQYTINHNVFEQVLFSQERFNQIAKIILTAILALKIINTLLDQNPSTKQQGLKTISNIIEVFKGSGYDLVSLLKNHNGICKMLLAALNSTASPIPVLPHAVNIRQYFNMNVNEVHLIQKDNYFIEYLKSIRNMSTHDPKKFYKIFVEVLNYIEDSKQTVISKLFPNLNRLIIDYNNLKSQLRKNTFITYDGIRVISLSLHGGGKNSKKKNKKNSKKKVKK